MFITLGNCANRNALMRNIYHEFNTRPLLLSGLLTSVVFMAACSPKDSPQQNNSSEPKDASQEIMDQLKTKPIKTFPSTPDDAHDIALLEEYDQKFTENNNALEADLKKRVLLMEALLKK